MTRMHFRLRRARTRRQRLVRRLDDGVGRVSWFFTRRLARGVKAELRKVSLGRRAT